MHFKPASWLRLFQGVGATVVGVLLTWALGRSSAPPGRVTSPADSTPPLAAAAVGVVPSPPRVGFDQRAEPPAAKLPSDDTAEPVRWTDDLLLVPEGCSDLEALRRALLRSGFRLSTSEASSELSRHAARGGSIESPAVRGWARRRFQTRFALAVQCTVTTRKLADEPLGSPTLQSAAGGVEVAKVELGLSRIDLRSGQRSANSGGSAEAFAIDRGTAIDKAFDQALVAVPAILKDARN